MEENNKKISENNVLIYDISDDLKEIQKLIYNNDIE